MQIISKSVQELGAEKKLICRPLEFFRIKRKNRGDGLCSCATQCQNGRSMIEMLGVLAIIGVLSVGGIMGYSKAMHRYRINKAIEQITHITGNIRTFFGPQKNYHGVGVSSVMLKAKLFPNEMIEYKNDGTFKRFTNVFGYDVYLNDLNKYFIINYYIGNNVETCIDLLIQDWTMANVKAIKLNLHYDGDFIFKTPISLELAVSYCSNAIDIVNNNADDRANGYPNLEFFVDVPANMMDELGTMWGGYKN